MAKFVYIPFFVAGLLERFDNIAGIQLDLFERYIALLQRYAKELETTKKLYQKSKASPPIPRNLPPISGKVAWVRQLYR